MRRMVLLLSLLAVFCLVFGPVALAQEGDTFMLEEITVTAEKRAVSLQDSPSSVVAIQGDALQTQGMITTEEILDNIPNVTFLDGSGNTEGNIAIRGIQRPQVAAGGPGLETVLPSATSVYVDGIYLGIGGEYDIDRVEVLRGPQGTLYGRSATGGVISFYTKDPKMEIFEGNFSAEVGSDALVNTSGALNVPIGEKVALRAAARYYTRDTLIDEGSAVGSQEAKEARLKARFQPTDQLDIVVHGATKERTTWSGGWSQVLDSPNDINYTQPGSYNAPQKKSPAEKFNQFGLDADYDFGDYTLTWIAGYHDYENLALNPETITTDAYGNRVGRGGGVVFPKDEYMTQEVRLASDDSWNGWFTWIVGANYFKNEYVSTLHNRTVEIYALSDQAYADGARVGQGTIDSVLIFYDGQIENYGIFTEETFELTDDFRITAGLRYDKTEMVNTLTFNQGLYSTSDGAGGHLPYLVDGEYAYTTTSIEDIPTEWDNITYKLRFEYDLTPDNMVYFTASSGFLPGFAGLTIDNKMGTWQVNIFDEQEMLAYQIGTKNEFMNNRMRLNGSVFYYDLKGYTDAYGLNDSGGGGPGWTPVALDKVTVYGLDLDGEFLMTANDKLTFNIGYLNTEITPPDTITWKSGRVTPGSALLMIDEQTGHPSWEGTLGYDHTFTLADGATLVPRVEVHYTGEYFLDNYTIDQFETLGDVEPWLHQDGYAVVNANLTWTSASQMYSVNGWVRNAFDEEYKREVSLSRDPPLEGYTGVTPGDPRTFGLMMNVKF